MTKKFDPKITPGPWNTFKFHDDDEDELIQIVSMDFDTVCEFGDKEEGDQRSGTEPCGDNLKAILAVPEMLHVVNAARRVIDSFEEKFLVFEHLEGGLAILKLSEAIQALDEKHGTEGEN